MKVIINHFKINLFLNVVFGEGCSNEVGALVKKYGNTVMLVTCPWNDLQAENFDRITKNLEKNGLKVILYDNACPNPTRDSINEASKLARFEGVDVVIGLGGGSAIDTAKGVSLGATHDSDIWDYTLAAEKFPKINEENLLPVIAITTTSGTGSHVTPYSVLQCNKLKRKTCLIITNVMIPKIAVVDPNLMVSMPPGLTVETGFDAFSHAFESYMSEKASVFLEMLALNSIEIIFKTLTKVCDSGSNIDLRSDMAYADTLSGMCITLSNTSLPHEAGQALVGKVPSLTHGRSVALFYPEYLKLILPHNTDKFAEIARILDNNLMKADNTEAALKLPDLLISWMKEAGIYTTSSYFNLDRNLIDTIIDESYKNCLALTAKIGLTEDCYGALIKRIVI